MPRAPAISPSRRLGNLALSIVIAALPAAAQERREVAPSLPADEAGRSRMGAEHMIAFGRKSLGEARARAGRSERRRRLLEEGETRLQRGEDPCTVYADIQKAATTF
jgi:hypothetical protein